MLIPKGKNGFVNHEIYVEVLCKTNKLKKTAKVTPYLGKNTVEWKMKNNKKKGYRNRISINKTKLFKVNK